MNRIPLTVQSDLAEASYEQALIELYEKLKLKYPVRYCTLEVSLWDADLAINIMGKYRNCDVIISQDKKVDEWEVRLLIQNTCIYSDGA